LNSHGEKCSGNSPHHRHCRRSGAKHRFLYPLARACALVKITVNFDDPASYHFNYGDERAWVSFLSLFNIQLLNRAPDWSARVLAVALLVFQGAVAGGSAAWGAIGAHAGISQALLWAGVGAVISAASAFFLRVSDVGPDLTPWDYWRLLPVKSRSRWSGTG